MKGKQVNIPVVLTTVLSGNALELGDASESPGKSFLFFLTKHQPVEWNYSEMLGGVWQSS